MKKIITMFCMLMAVSFFSHAQKMAASGVPSNVRNKLGQLYPEVKSAQWIKAGANYKAEFMDHGTPALILLNSKAEVLETGLAIPMEKVPAKVKAYASNNLPGKKISNTTILNDAKGNTSFVLAIEGTDYVLDPYGKLLKTEKAAE